MTIECIKTTSEGFDLNEVTTVQSNSFDYNYGGSGVELNQVYFVMGMQINKFSNCLYYLIDINGKPDWFPYLLFEVIDNSLPNNWFISVINKNSDGSLFIISGFDELCNLDNFHDDLIEREDEAMMIYYKRKIEYEKEMLQE